MSALIALATTISWVMPTLYEDGVGIEPDKILFGPVYTDEHEYVGHAFGTPGERLSVTIEASCGTWYVVAYDPETELTSVPSEPATKNCGCGNSCHGL